MRYNESLVPTAKRLEEFFHHCLDGEPRIDRVSVRAKSITSFINKASKTDNEGNKKYSDPLNQIQDQIGARIICFYLSDVMRLDMIVNKYFRKIEDRTVFPDSEFAFGYFGKHYILMTPDDVIDDECPVRPNYFELQIKTLYQHAWSEANHDLQYKSESDLDKELLRKVAFTSAQSWGADQMFDDLIRTLSDGKGNV
jgi:ppGpp synthetase/RelA/SpoT-type nucleotidyltranferase